MKAIKAAGHVVWTSDNKPLLLSRTVLEELIVDRSCVEHHRWAIKLKNIHDGRRLTDLYDPENPEEYGSSFEDNNFTTHRIGCCVFDGPTWKIIIAAIKAAQKNYQFSSASTDD